MGTKSPRYLELKVKGQPFVYMVTKVIYKDKKGRFSKFVSGKKLRVEVYAEAEVVDKKTGKLTLHNRLIRKHSLGYAKRKNPTTIEHIKKNILRKARKSRGSIRLKKINGIFKFVSDKMVTRKKRGKGVHTVKIKRGVLDGYFKTFEASLSGNH